MMHTLTTLRLISQDVHIQDKRNGLEASPTNKILPLFHFHLVGSNGNEGIQLWRSLPWVAVIYFLYNLLICCCVDLTAVLCCAVFSPTNSFLSWRKTAEQMAPVPMKNESLGEKRESYLAIGRSLKLRWFLFLLVF
jgi:hypothetical protein